MKYFNSILIIFCINFSLSAQTVYNLNSESSFMDQNKKLIIANYIPEGYISGTDVSFELENEQYELQSSPSNLVYGTPYELLKNSETYTLYFSELPLLNIQSYEAITTEGEDLVPGKIEISDTSDLNFQSFIGIKVRGATSRTFPKKSYQIRMWTDSASGVEKDEAFFEMREDDKWLLLAMWNEKARINNMFSHNLWLRMHELYYAQEEPKANSAIRMKYVEMFLDGSYQGVYAFSENMDRKQLKLKKTSNDAVRGELYKGKDWGEGLVTFEMENVPPYDDNSLFWDGYEMKYPKDLPADWSMLNDFAYFVGESSAESFKAGVFEQFYKENAMDYFIFLNIIHAGDNTGKNIFLAKYRDGEPYFYAPWDLDGTIGYHWTGDRIYDTDNILTNNLYDRLMELNPDNYNTDISERWFSLRETVLENEVLKTRIDSLNNYLTVTGAYEREHLAWPGYNLDAHEVDYIKDWLDERIDVLDTFFYYQAHSIHEIPDSFADKIKIGFYNDEFTVFFDKTLGHRQLEYQLYNVSGQLLSTGKVSRSQNKINGSSLPPAMYMIRFFNKMNGHAFTKKAAKF